MFSSRHVFQNSPPHALMDELIGQSLKEESVPRNFFRVFSPFELPPRHGLLVRLSGGRTAVCLLPLI